MKLLRIAAEFIYFTTSLLIALPILAYLTLSGRFLHSFPFFVVVIILIAWIVIGFFLLSNWRRSRSNKLRRIISSIAPGFEPQVEISDYFSTQYVGIDTMMKKTVVIDREKNVAKFEEITYIKMVEIDDAKDNVVSIFTFNFRDFINPYMKIRINRLRAEETRSRFRFALENHGS